MAATPFSENLLQRFLLTTGAITTRPTVWYVGLHVGAAGASGAANEIVGNGYARQAQTFTVTNNIATGVASLTFGPNTGTNWGTVTDFSLWDAATAGNCLWTGTVGAPVAYAVGDSATLAGSALTFTLT